MKTLTIISLLVLLFFIQYACNDSKPEQPIVNSSIESPVPISPNIPVDVDPVLQIKIKNYKTNFYELNKEFNKFSWQAFVAILWPLDAEGSPMPNFTDVGQSTWLTWKEAFQVYRSDGGIPASWGAPRTAGGLPHDYKYVDKGDLRIYLSKETPAHKGKNIADEVDQAFAGRLFDQAGNTVVYEVLMNKEEYDYIVGNKLYNINGQVEFTSTGQIANFPKGDFKTHKVGAIEIKVAWKILTDADQKERYYRNQGYVVVDEKTGELAKRDLGMIGFHISQKTPTGKQWVWSTFEHIDNLDQNMMEKDGQQIPIHPTLTDPNCEICPVNVDLYSPKNKYTFHQDTHSSFWVDTTILTKKDTIIHYYYTNTEKMVTQSKRMIDIPIRVQQLNQAMQAYFKSQNSVFQYYQLIDTQYPTDQDAPPGNATEKGYHLPESVWNKSGGKPNLAYLTNISMETFFQDGNQPATKLIEDFPKSNINIFGTENCMGCHSSAGIYTFREEGKIAHINNKIIKIDGKIVRVLPQLSGDFSWLLSQKARVDKSKTSTEE